MAGEIGSEVWCWCLTFCALHQLACTPASVASPNLWPSPSAHAGTQQRSQRSAGVRVTSLSSPLNTPGGYVNCAPQGCGACTGTCCISQRLKPLADCLPCHGPACSAREASPAHSWTAAFMTLASGESAPCSSPQCPVSHADKSPCPDSSKLACAHSQLMYPLERDARTTHGDCSCC